MSELKLVWEPFKLGNLNLRNRIVSTAHSPAYGEDGMPKLRYQLYHEEKAKGGIALTMFGGSSSVSADSPASFGQLDVSGDAIIPVFEEFAERIHAHDAALICQISHMGRRTTWDSGDWMPPISAGTEPEPAHMSFAKPMEKEDFERVRIDYASAAQRCKSGGLDGCEVFVSGHLLGQFWSPAINRRVDEYGGSTENRLRFTFEVLEGIREKVGDFLVGIRFSADEMIAGGLDVDDTVEIGLRISESGLVDYFNLVSSNNWTFPGVAKSVPTMAYGSMPAVRLVGKIRNATGMPVVHACRIGDLRTAEHALASGYVDLVGMTRAHIADPRHLAKFRDGREAEIRPCVGAGYCIDRIYAGREALCVHNASTGRERTFPQEVPRSVGRRKKVVVVGAGPGGLEAARICAERGHEVVIFEAASKPGGQVLLAAQATWRKELIGIVRWRIDRLDVLGVSVRCDSLADKAEVLAESPDVVIVATGGVPNTEFFEGANLACSTWDILSRSVRPGKSVLVYDDHGQHQGLSTAEAIAESGASTIEFATPARQPGNGLGPTNFSIHLRNLYSAGVAMTPNHRLLRIERAGGRLICTLQNEYDQSRIQRTVDDVVVERGTVPSDALYFALKDLSRNGGVVDLEAISRHRAKSCCANPNGRFELFRIGDAISSRNIHAAIYDALRVGMCI
ncbi:MAG: NADH:flavin oxidoreductase [Albidovulum sp.]|nr:NADH:flavin oxidoreductase [Albidovulum sp.]